jgi:hypothetical protein
MNEFLKIISTHNSIEDFLFDCSFCTDFSSIEALTVNPRLKKLAITGLKGDSRYHEAPPFLLELLKKYPNIEELSLAFEGDQDDQYNAWFDQTSAQVHRWLIQQYTALTTPL